jgi:phage repressor protein C with HTH and peptisase S24 domain
MEHAIPYYTNDVLQGQALARLRRGEPVAPLRRIAGLPEFEGCAAFPVHGDEMAPLLTSGMIIFCRRIDHWREFLAWGHVYAIPTQVGNLRYIGRVLERDKNDFTIHRDNPIYPDFRLPKKEVATMWLVEGRLDKII